MEEQIKTLTNPHPLHRTELMNSIERPDTGPAGFQSTSSIPSPAQPQPSQSTQQNLGRHDNPYSTSKAFSLDTPTSPSTGTVSGPRLNTSEAKITDSAVAADGSFPNSLSLMSLTEVSRLINLYEDETGSIYPFLDIEQVQSCASNFHHNVGRNGGASQEYMSGTETTRGWDNDLDILKIVLAIALAIEGCGFSEMGKKLIGEVEHSIDQGIAAHKADMRGLKVLTLMVSTATLLSNEADHDRAFTNFTATKRFLPGERLAWLSGLPLRLDCIGVRRSCGFAMHLNDRG